MHHSSCLKSRAPPGGGRRRPILDALVLESYAELEPSSVVHPTRIQLHRLRARRQRGITKHLLLGHGRRVEDIRNVERHLHVVVELVAERAVQVAAVLLPDREAYAAVEVGREELGAPAVREPRTDLAELVEAYDVV